MPDQDISITFVTTDLNTGGAERHLAMLLPVLSQRGMTVSLYVVGDDGPMSRPLRAAGIPVRCLMQESRWIQSLRSPFRGLAAYLISVIHLHREIRRARAAVCHAFLPMAVIVSGLTTSVSGVRTVASRRSLRHYQAAAPWGARLERFLMRRMDAVLGNSQAVVKELAEEGVDPARLGLIYNGVQAIGRPTDDRKRDLRRPMGITEDQLVMVVVANLIPYKGHRDLIAALQLARDGLPDRWRLLCVGRDDGIGGDLLSFVEECGLEEYIRFLGECADPSDFYRMADIGILASHQEGFSNTILEAMSAGLPVIATDVGGNAEALGGGAVGRLVPASDPDAMAAAVLELAQNRELRRDLGALAEERTRTLYAIDHCADQYERLYRGLVGARGSVVGELLEGGVERQTAEAK